MNLPERQDSFPFRLPADYSAEALTKEGDSAPDIQQGYFEQKSERSAERLPRRHAAVLMAATSQRLKARGQTQVQAQRQFHFFPRISTTVSWRFFRCPLTLKLGRENYCFDWQTRLYPKVRRDFAEPERVDWKELFAVQGAEQTAEPNFSRRFFFEKAE